MNQPARVETESSAMDVLRLGSRGAAVESLQRALIADGSRLNPDGDFGPNTDAAVRDWQKRHGLVPDGIVGAKTRAALAGAPVPAPLSHADIEAAADTLGVDVPAVLAVNEVESSGAGFIAGTDLPKILFERHIMYRRLEAHGLDAETAEAAHPDLVNTRPGGYRGGAAEHSRLHSAEQIHRASAIESASWGAFQILGEHWQRLGYTSADDYAGQMAQSEAAQLEAFVRFVIADRVLHEALRRHDWAAFAHRYNGPNYQRYDYDHKTAAAFRRHRAPEAIPA